MTNGLKELRELTALISIAKNWYAPVTIRLAPFVGQSKQTRVRIRNGCCLFVRPKKGEIMVLNEVLYHHVYSKFFPVNGITVDIGANIGVFSVYASKLATRVLAFEPCASNYDILKKNLALNGLTNVDTFQVAIAGKNGVRRLTTDPETSGGHTFYPFLPDFVETIEVTAITLEDVFVQNNLEMVNFLKMDCEGAELEIIENTPTELLTKIHRMVIECHRGNGKKIMEILTKSGFRVVYGDKSTLYACLQEP